MTFRKHQLSQPPHSKQPHFWVFASGQKKLTRPESPSKVVRAESKGSESASFNTPYRQVKESTTLNPGTGRRTPRAAA